MRKAKLTMLECSKSAQHEYCTSCELMFSWVWVCPLEESSFMFGLSGLWFVISQSYNITANFGVRLHVGNIY